MLINKLHRLHTVKMNEYNIRVIWYLNQINKLFSKFIINT